MWRYAFYLVDLDELDAGLLLHCADRLAALSDDHPNKLLGNGELDAHAVLARGTARLDLGRELLPLVLDAVQVTVVAHM